MNSAAASAILLLQLFETTVLVEGPDRLLLANEDREDGPMEELRLFGTAFSEYHCLLFVRGGVLGSGCFLDSMISWGY